MEKVNKFLMPLGMIGAFNPISMSLKLNILGLTERLVIYTIQVLIFILSYYYTFRENKINDFTVG